MKELSENFIIGVDVSKEKLDIWELSTEHHVVIKNERRAIGNYFRHISKKEAKIQVLLEPTGGYENDLIKQLLEYDQEVYMIHPNRLMHFAKSQGLVAKTDKLAAKQLALYLKMQPAEKLKLVKASYIQTKRLQELSSRRQQVKEHLQAEKNRKGHSFFHPELKRSHQRQIKQLEEELGKIEALLEKEIAEREELKEKEALLKSFKGVGKITAQMLLVELPELGNLSREEVAKMVGVAPLNRDSGQKQGRRYIQGGRSQVRKGLYMAALVAVRYNEEMRRLFEQHRAKGKEFKVALVAIMRKMICCLNSMVKKNMTWQELIGLTAQ